MIWWLLPVETIIRLILIAVVVVGVVVALDISVIDLVTASLVGAIRPFTVVRGV